MSTPGADNTKWIDPDTLADGVGALMGQITEAEAAGLQVPCRASRDRALWTSNRVPDLDRAALACHDCPALDACRTYALDHWESAGTWGGLTPAGRTAARKNTTTKENTK